MRNEHEIERTSANEQIRTLNVTSVENRGAIAHLKKENVQLKKDTELATNANKETRTELKTLQTIHSSLEIVRLRNIYYII